ncbi:hypothetical protein BDV35DRAFT_397410 [Aspergillus flavus]|uniref:MARVEL domain-containing protein n=1 Tax=Aspergillus flavus TaxID=5059 RepID=A0A5N6GHB4_ASPFL|nr:hypothetical protein BDV35DRAFT_397410 [Aspergillus flavus]RAQ62863.1 hypothetical protein COH20_011361 [Aspergillus flavus]RAQ79216.1 hypothetical protein COH21_012679 [Aspergillus flavus]
MAPPGVFFSLRVSQAIYAVATFALLCAAGHSYLTAFDHVPWEVSLAILSSCLSLVAVTYKAYTSLSPSQGLSKASTFALYWLVSFVSLVAFVCLAKFLSEASECEGSLCIVTKISTVVIFFSYAVWTAATTLVGIEISKDHGKAKTAVQEKLKALSDE